MPKTEINPQLLVSSFRAEPSLRAPIAVIPAFNEQEMISKVLTRTLEQNVHTVVIDDGSTDKTYQIISKFRKYGVHILRNNSNLGKGDAIKKAREYILNNKILSKAKSVVILDADYQYDPVLIRDLTKDIQENKVDIVLGVRPKIRFTRHYIANKIWRVTFNILFDYRDVEGNEIRDICAIRAYSMRLFKEIENFGLGYLTEANMLIKAAKNGWRISQSILQEDKFFYYEKSPILRGIRMFYGIEFHILKEGLKYRLGKRK